jgi:hypothetical protein
VAGFYFVYQAVSNLVAGDRRQALADALAEVHLERALGVFYEQAAQAWALRYVWVVKASDVFYATVPFVLPVMVLSWLWLRHPDRYRYWRNTLGWLSGAALMVFVVDPVAPPRLLPHRFGFVDTLSSVGGAGPLDHLLLSSAGNPYAAMPSLHVAWAAWCAAAVMSAVRSPSVRGVILAHPMATIFVVVVTANHLFLDAAGGMLALFLGMGLARVPWARAGGAVVRWALAAG